MPEFNIPDVTGLPKQERRRRVVIVVIPGATPLEFIGPMEFLGEANFMLDHSHRSDLGYDIALPAPGASRSNIRRARSGAFPVSMSSAISSPVAGLIQTPSPPKRVAT